MNELITATDNTPLTEQHRILYNLRYVSNIADPFQLADEMSLTVEEVDAMLQQLDAYLLAKLRMITPDRLQFVCTECLGTRVYEDPESHEKVCTDCGFVLGEVMEMDESLPFDVTYAPASELSVNRSLGGSITRRDQCRLQRQNGDGTLAFAAFQQRNPDVARRLRNGEIFFDSDNAYYLDSERKRVSRISLKDVGAWTLNSKKLSLIDLAKLFHLNDVPLRAKRVRIMTSSENLDLDSLLYAAFELSTRHKLEKDKVFNNNLGRNIRRAHWLVHDLKIKTSKRRLVDTMFYFTLCQNRKVCMTIQSHAQPQKEPQKNLDIDDGLFDLFLKHDDFLDDAKKATETQTISEMAVPQSF